MTKLNMYPTLSNVRIKATYINRIPSGDVSYTPFRHFVLLKKNIVYSQGPIALHVVKQNMFHYPHAFLKKRRGYCYRLRPSVRLSFRYAISS